MPFGGKYYVFTPYLCDFMVYYYDFVVAIYLHAFLKHNHILRSVRIFKNQKPIGTRKNLLNDVQMCQIALLLYTRDSIKYIYFFNLSGSYAVNSNFNFRQESFLPHFSTAVEFSPINFVNNTSVKTQSAEHFIQFQFVCQHSMITIVY